MSNNASNLFLVQPTLDTNGTLTFTPLVGQVGQALVTVRLQDDGGTFSGGQNTSAPQTFILTVLLSNKPPLAQAASFQGLEDTVLYGTVSGTDPDGDPLTFRELNAPAVGQVALQPSGQFAYTPPANYHGPVNFTFAAHDGQLESAPATVSIQVESVNDAPSFVAGPTLRVLEDSGLSSWAGWASGMSAGPADEAGQRLQFVVSVDKPELFAEGPALSPEQSRR